MTHDPLCPARPFDDGTPSRADCRCALIARVREDERDRHLDRWRKEVLLEVDAHRAVGYAAALRDAVEAVKAVEGGDRFALTRWMRNAYIAAIEALGGER